MAELWEREDLKAEWRIWIATRPGVLTDRELRLFACWCCRQIWHLLTDERSRHAVEIAELYAEGKATSDDLTAARDAAWAAARAATGAAAEDAAEAASEAAAWDEAWDEERDAAGDAAGDAAWYATRAAAGYAAEASAWASSQAEERASAEAASVAAQVAYLKQHAHPRF